MRKISLLLCLVFLCFCMAACEDGSQSISASIHSISESLEEPSSISEISGPTLDQLVLSVDNLQESYDIDKTIQAQVETVPAADEPIPLIYQSSDPKVATFSDGTIHTLSEGETRLTVTTEDGEITSNTITIQVEDVQKKEEQALLQAQAKEAEDAINQIQDVTLNSGGQITQARTIYNRLSDDAKAYIPNLDVLESAEKRFATLQEEQARQEAEAAANQILANVPEENIGPPPVQEPAEEPAEDIQGEEEEENGHGLYITRTGKKYHFDPNCNGGTYFSATWDQVRARGLQPCQKCVE